MSADRFVGGGGVVEPQLSHLSKPGERNKKALHGMPLSVPVRDGLDGESSALDFGETESVGHLEFPDGAIRPGGGKRVVACREAGNRLCSTAPIRSALFRRYRKRANALS